MFFSLCQPVCGFLSKSFSILRFRFFQYYIYFPKIANDNLQKIGAAAGAVQKPLYISPSAGYKTSMF
jgi:hypothetical protein